MRNMKENIEKILYAIIIAGILTVVVNPSVNIFLFFSDAIWLLILVMYANRKNGQFFQRGMIVFTGVIIGYVMTKLLCGHMLRQLFLPELLLCIILLLEMITALFFCYSRNNEKENNNKLYDERKYDLERIQDFIIKMEILGINAPWGMGKSFLMDKIKQSQKIKENFDVVQIDLLTCDLDAVDLILVEEIEKIFRKNQVYPDNSRGLKRILNKNKWLSLLSELVLGNNEGMAASFDGYVKEFDKLSKKILLIFEDIDRIEDTNTIKKIFAISEKLAGERLHVIYQFDGKELDEKGFSKLYLEKYIPYTVNLTKIRYEKLVSYLWDELNMSETPLEKNKVCRIVTDWPHLYDMTRILGVEMTLSVHIQDVSIRRVRFFLNELKMIISQIPEFQKKDVLDIVIRVMFIKHFFRTYYDEFQIGESPLENLLFEGEEGTYTMVDVLNRFRKGKCEDEKTRKERIKELNKFINNKDNQTICTLILLLGYELQVEDVGQEFEEYVTESYRNLKRKEKNEKIDRVLWNVLANGTSELTDMENAVKKLLCEVIYKEGEEQETAWEKYLEDMYHERLPKNNRTIFRFGVDMYLPLFRALKIYDASSKEWLAFLKFYFSHYQKERKEKSISLSLIDNLNYCKLDDKQILFAVIRFFNQLGIQYNLNGNKSYKNFFEDYMGAITNLGYCKSMEYWMFQFESPFYQNVDSILHTLQMLKDDLQKCQGEYKASYIIEEFSDIITFVEKNQELIQCSNSSPERGPSVSITEMKSRWKHQDEVDYLLELKEKCQNGELEQEQFLEAVKERYCDGRLFLPEYRDVMKHDDE